MNDAPEPTKVFIEPGRRTGRRLSNEGQFIAAIAEGKQPYTRLNGVWFEISTLESAPNVPIYTALAFKPVGL